MTLRRLLVTGSLAAVVLGALCIRNVAWNIEAVKAPRVIDPGSSTKAPSDAIVLFDGKNLDEWVGKKGGGAWKVEDGIMTIAPGTGDMYTKRKFGDIQRDMEWRIPADAKRKGESKGNSGIKFHSAYEIQVLDGDKSKHGMGAVINESKSPYHLYNGVGKWNSYDIVFRAARFKDGKLSEKAIVSMYFNGKKAHTNVAINKVWGGPNSGLDGGNQGGRGITDVPGGLKLQCEGHDVRYRNTWIKELDLKKADTDF